jgi:hypothetical protein
MADFIPFDEFLRRTSQARQGRELRDVAVRDTTELEKMRSHILSLYRGVRPVHSFVDEGGQYFDCIPADEQPSLRQPDGSFARLQEPPPAPRTPGADRMPPLAAPAPAAATNDEFGNRRSCPQGTIAMRRLTLEEMARYKTLRDFFSKELPRPETDVPPAAGAFLHRYASTEQVVDNFGGSSVLNLWAPNPAPGRFSLSQIWCIGGPLIIGNPNLQTVEVGWQVNPNKYHHAKPVLFVYWTGDGYTNTGSYNLEKNEFVVSPSPGTWSIGGAFPTTSTPGGGQVDVTVQFLREPVFGNWWLYVGYPPATPTAVGYYPRTLFGSGQLASNAQRIQFGGEVTTEDGTLTSGPMGSGEFAAAGYGKAAYQRQAMYYSLLGIPTAPTLTGNDTPGCYTLDVHNNTPDATWGTYFFFGGPKCP